jgi:putative peptidoglycan binding protein
LRIAAPMALVCLLPLLISAQQTPDKKPPSRTKHSTKKSSSAAKATGKTGTKARKKGSKKKAAQSWRTRQSAPTPQRYKEIQEALAKRGYLEGTPSGVWDTQSSEALRRFQQDQSLEPTGKLNSLSLIALGLGAKHAPQPAPARSPSAPPSGPPRQPAPSAPQIDALPQLPPAPHENNPSPSPTPPPPDATR